MADNQIEIEILLDDGSVQKAFANIKKSADDLSSDSSGVGLFNKKLGDITLGWVAVAAAATKAFGIIQGAANDAISAARENQKAIDDLSAALFNNGAFTQKAVENFDAFAGALSKTTGIADNVITQNAALLASMGKLSGEGLEVATKAAIDLSAATGKDIGSSFAALAKAASGSTEVLSRFGIKIDESVPKNERYALALAKIQEKFGGLAELKAQGFEGTISRLENAIDELFESFGNFIVQNPAVRAVINVTIQLIDQLTGYIKTLAAQDAVTNFIKQFFAFAQGVNTYLVQPIEIFFNLMKTGALAVSTAFYGVVNVLATVGTAIFDALVKPIVDFFGGTLAKIVGLFDSELAGKIEAAISGTTQKISELGQATAQGAGEMFSTTLESTAVAAETAFDATVSNNIGGILAQYQTALAVVKEGAATSGFTDQPVLPPEEQNASMIESITVAESFSLALQGVQDKMMSMAESGKKNFKELGAQMFQSMGAGAGQAFAAFGKALATGQNALSAFGKAMIGAFGSALVQLGTGYILQGIAMTYAYDPNGPPLIAAGAGLAALGGALSAVGGGGASAPSTGGGGGGATTGGFGTEAPAPVNERTTAVSINVEGTVLDPIGVGQKIAEILNETFDATGSSFRTAVA